MSYSSKTAKQRLLDQFTGRRSSPATKFSRSELQTLRELKRSGEVKSYVGDSGRQHFYRTGR